MPQPNTSSFTTPDLQVIVRSTIYSVSMVTTTLLFGPVMLLTAFLPFRIRYAIAKGWVIYNLWVLQKVCGLTWIVEGMENIPERNGVILCKHQSAWETIALQTIFPPVVFILKKSLLYLPVWGWAMATLKPIAIDRSAKSAALKQILSKGVERIKAGHWVVVFPEGTRVPPGEKGKYLPGGAMLAHKAGCPVLPVAHNAGEFWKRNAYLKYPGVIQVRIGPAIDGTVLSAAEINKKAEEWIEQQMSEISFQSLRNSDDSATSKSRA
jgi:1-acyl-sn-glycerol-3-phosphate acyltransferase